LTPTAIALSAFLVLAAAALALSFVPRAAIGRAQDRLARRLLADRLPGAQSQPFSLLTRAELVAGKWRRHAGVLGLAGQAIVFEGLFGEILVLATPRIRKIATGRRMASGRLLFRMEVLRITSTDGSESEFVLTPASASMWRSHLGLWAMAERVRDAEGSNGSAFPPETDQVVPGRR
jgi:hypothetical protein